MTKDNKDILLRLLQQHKELITTDEIVNQFNYNPLIANQYLHQLTELGFLKTHGSDKNRTYKKT